MGIKNITGSLFTDWQWLLQPCQIVASASKLSSQDVKQTGKATRMEERCGQGCQLQDFAGTSQWMNGLKGWKHTSHNHGIARHTRTQSYHSTDVNQAPGLQKSQESFTQRDISSLWITPKAKSQTVQPNTSRVTLWC